MHFCTLGEFHIVEPGCIEMANTFTYICLIAPRQAQPESPPWLKEKPAGLEEKKITFSFSMIHCNSVPAMFILTAECFKISKPRLGKWVWGGSDEIKQLPISILVRGQLGSSGIPLL